MNTQTVSKKDMEIIQIHKKQFLKPIVAIAKLIESGLTDDEILHNCKFKQVALELKEIEKQGLKKQFLIFYKLIMM